MFFYLPFISSIISTRFANVIFVLHIEVIVLNGQSEG